MTRAFIDKWVASDGGERSNYQLFLTELCELIEAPKPEAAIADESRNAYIFERAVPNRRREGPDSRNFIDLYKRGCFVLEAKQSAKRVHQLREVRRLEMDMPTQRTGSGRRGGAGWDEMMRNARAQAEGYAKNLPASEGWPPFLVVVDVGHVIERTIILSPVERRDKIELDMLPPEVMGQDGNSGSAITNMMGSPLREARETFEREYLRIQIRRFSGNVSRTATFIGMERSALHRKLKLLGISDRKKEGD